MTPIPVPELLRSTTMLLISFVFCLYVELSQAAGATTTTTTNYPLYLSNIFISHGDLSPAFNSKILDYTVQLHHALDQIAITPEINQTAYKNENDIPLVTLKWGNHMNNKAESSSMAVRRQIDLPDQGEKSIVYINVANPHETSKVNTYSIKIFQVQNEPLVLLKGLEADDYNGLPVSIEPVVTEDDNLYNVYVTPDAESFSLIPKCAQGNWVSIDGRTVSNNQPVNIIREKNHHRQIVELTCGYGSALSKKIIKKNYIISIFSDFLDNDIPYPRLLISGRGRDCIFEKVEFNCPNPKANDYKVRIIGFSEPSIQYTIESSDKSVEIRLLNKIPSISFSYANVGTLYVKAVAGRNSKSWPLNFKGVPTSGLMRFLGVLLGVILAALLLSLLFVLGATNTLGIGTPIGVTEIYSAMTLLLQFFCFISALRGTSILTNMSEPLKWVTLYWPLPWTVTIHNNNPSRWGDVSQLTNAYGCLFWSATSFSSLILVHLLIISKKKLVDRDRTFAHWLKFGNWEQRFIHWISFPVCVASASILKHPQASIFWRFIAGFFLSSMGIWALTVFILIRSRISSKDIIWVWNSSVREDGGEEDEAGYWSDIICNQLVTQPVNRSLFKWFFPWRWVATVADIMPVNICPRVFTRGDEETDGLYPLNEYQRSHKETSYPLGKNPKIIDMIQTPAPNKLCPGQRLIAGLMRTDWIDFLFTYQSITFFHSEMKKNSDLVIPLTVKTCQLRGPITGGIFHFFFDGTRIPFIRIADSMYRLIIGLLLGLALSSESYSLDTIAYSFIGILSAALLAYHISGKPYTRSLENWILGALLFSIAATSFSFMAYSIKHTSISLIGDIFLWLTSITSTLLAAYAALVIFSVYSAITCPPLEETRFLENLANCNVSITDHESGWAVDVPAYNKKGARDLKAQCNVDETTKLHVSVYPSGEEPTLEFEAAEMAQACRSGSLQAPILVLYCPAADDLLGYRHVNIYEKSSLHADVASFLALDRDLRYVADHVARNIAHQVETRGRGKAVLSMTLVPPKRSLMKSGSRSQSTFTSSSNSIRQRSQLHQIEMSEK